MSSTTKGLPPSKWIPVFRRFLSNLKIQSKDTPGGLDGSGSSLDLWGSQERFLKALEEGLSRNQHKFYFLKSRQLGITTISLAVDLFYLAMFPGTKAALIVDEDRNREQFRSVLKNYVKSFPPDFFGDGFGIVKGGDNRFGMKFSNNSQLDFLVAGLKEKESFGDGGGYSLCHFTEVGRYGCEGALRSFEQALSERNPNRLYIYESRAAGPNHWQNMWRQAGKDIYTIRREFIGWWSHPGQIITKADPRWTAYGTLPPDADERDLIHAVKEMYDHDVTREQLAWYRWRADDEGVEIEVLNAQQPWTEDQAFVVAGTTFFHIRLLSQDYDRIGDPNGDVVFRAYRYQMSDSFFDTHIEEMFEGSDASNWHLRIWEHPVKGAKYVIGVDPAFGRNDNHNNSCLHEDAEILTSAGWKRYSEISIGDRAACFDPETETYSYGTVSNVIVRDYEGDLVRIKSRDVDCPVTPDHRVLYRHYQAPSTGAPRPWTFLPAEEAAVGGETVREIPLAGASHGAGVDGLTPEMCRALGWIVTDGHIGRPKYLGHGHREGQKTIRPFIVLVQAVQTEKNETNIADVMTKGILALCPEAYAKVSPPSGNKAKSDKVTIRIGAEHAAQFMRWLTVPDGRLSREIIENGSREQLEALMLGILEGDGIWSRKLGRWIGVCPGLDEGLADDIQEIALKLGRAATKTYQPARRPNEKGQWKIYLSKRKTNVFKPKATQSLSYKGKVWCVTVPTGAFVARYQGKAFVTGNCISVWRCYADRLIQVAEYATDEDVVLHAARVLAHLAGNYEDCIINLEVTGPGAVVMQELDNLRGTLRHSNHREVVKERKIEDFLTAARWYIYSRPDSSAKPGGVYNFKTGYESKRRALNHLKNCHYDKTLVINSKPLVEEMLGVRMHDNEIGAMGRNNDDRVMAAALAAHAYKEWRQRDLVGQNYFYDDVTARESGDQTASNSPLGLIVRNYMKMIEQREADEDYDPIPASWEEQRGFG